MSLPDLLAPARLPADPIVLCHGLYGYDVRAILGVEMHYWAGIMDVLRERLGAEVIMKGVPPMGSIQERAEALHAYLCSPQAGIRGRKVHFVGHSMGGLDARYLITRIRPTPDQYTPLTLTTISTPHRGSPFMDWCNANIGIGRDLVESEISTARKQGIIPPAHTHSRHRHPDHDPDSAVPPPEDPVPTLPYSLKAPLFVRRPNSEPAANGKDSATAQSIPKPQTSPAPKSSPAPPLADNGQQKPKVSSPSSVPESRGEASLFTRALDSVGGGFSNWMLSLLDQPAYAMLSTRYMTLLFNPTVPNVRGVSYFSVAARIDKLPMWHPLWLPKLVLDASAASGTAASVRDGSAHAERSERGNDGIVAVHSAIWGHFLGVVEQADHWDLRGGGAPRFRAPRRDPITGRPIDTPAKHKQPSPRAKGQEKDPDDADQGWMGINRILRSLRRSPTSTATTSSKAKVKMPAGPATQSAFFSATVPPAPTPTPPPNSSSAPSQSETSTPTPVSNSISSTPSPLISPSPNSIASSSAGPATCLSEIEQVTMSEAPAAAQVANWISARLPDTRTPVPVPSRAHSAFVPLLPAPSATSVQTSVDAEGGVDAAEQTSAAVHTVLSSAPTWNAGSTPTPNQAANTATVSPFSPVDSESSSHHPDVPLASLSEEERLERFWAAVCRHLWERGY